MLRRYPINVRPSRSNTRCFSAGQNQQTPSMTHGTGSEGATRTEPALRSRTPPRSSSNLTVNVVDEARCPWNVVHVGLLSGGVRSWIRRGPSVFEPGPCTEPRKLLYTQKLNFRCTFNPPSTETQFKKNTFLCLECYINVAFEQINPKTCKLFKKLKY